MKFDLKKSVLLCITISIALFLMTACGGGGGGGDDDGSSGTTTLNVAGIWTGNWQSSQYGMSGTFTANVQQEGSTLSGTLTVPQINMNNATLTGTVTGDNMTFGDIEGTITFSGIVSSSASSASGTFNYMTNVSGTWSGNKN